MDFPHDQHGLVEFLLLSLFGLQLILAGNVSTPTLIRTSLVNEDVSYIRFYAYQVAVGAAG